MSQKRLDKIKENQAAGKYAGTQDTYAQNKGYKNWYEYNAGIETARVERQEGYAQRSAETEANKIQNPQVQGTAPIPQFQGPIQQRQPIQLGGKEPIQLGKEPGYFTPSEPGGTSEFGESKVGQFFGYQPESNAEVGFAALTVGAGPLVPVVDAIGSYIGTAVTQTFGKIMNVVTSKLSTSQQTKIISKEITRLSGGGNSLIGRIIPEANIQQIGKIAKLTKGGTQQLKRGLGTIRVNEVKQLIAGGAPNLKTAALKQGYLARLASTAKSPLLVLGLLGTTLYTSLFWAPNEKGDALTTLTIAQKAAVRAGDAELVDEIDALIQETYDISASIPLVGFIKSELAKFEAAAIASRASKAESDKQLADAQAEAGELTFGEERKQVDEEARERELNYREEDQEYYDQQAKDRRDLEIAEREEDQKDYREEAKDRRDLEIAEREEDQKDYREEATVKRALELVQMAEDTDYFNNIADETRARELRDRAEDEAYWAQVKGEDLEDEELEMLKAWNEGRSSLSFAWLK